MFSTLTQKLTAVFDRLRSSGVLREEDVTITLREVRLALLEADVALPVVKDFMERVRNEAVGRELLKSLQPAQLIIKIVHDELVRLLTHENPDLIIAGKPPLIYLMVGLQGAGKTTTTAKLARFLKKRTLMVSLDIYRPAAQEQLFKLGEQLSIPCFPPSSSKKPLEIIEDALTYAQKHGFECILFDTAGRLHIDDIMMREIQVIKHRLQPIETLLVADALMGQDALSVAQTFHEALTLTGVILTRIDGDSKGGAALSITHATGCPIKFLGTGEKTDQLEHFSADRIINRLLDQGDVVGLVEKAMALADQEESENLAKRLQKGQFNLEDLAQQLQTMLKMGGVVGFMQLLPGFSKMKDQMSKTVNDRVVHRQLALIRSMTVLEKRNPKILNASRRRRIAKGAGQEVSDLNRLLKNFEQMQTMMKRMRNEKSFSRGGFQGLFGR